MAVDLNLCREILIAAGEQADRGPVGAARFAPAEPQTVDAQIEALVAAGLVSASRPGCTLGVEALTASGREFLRLARNDVLWKRVNGELGGSGQEVTLQMVRARLLEWAQFSF